jgi:hypothetical protein
MANVLSGQDGDISDVNQQRRAGKAKENRKQ